MDTFSAFASLFSWNFLLFSLGIFVMTYIVRTIFEYSFKKFTASSFWTAICLALMPPVFGGLTGLFAKSYAYPGELHSTFERVIFGAVAGLLSGWIYKIAKDLVKSRIKTLEENNNSNSPDDLNK